MSSSSNPNSKGIVDSFNKMNPNAKMLTLMVGGYVFTIGLAVIIIALAIVILISLEVTNCSTMSQAMLGLWMILALVFLTSLILIGVVAWKIYSGFGGRLAVLAVYGIAMLMSFACFAFGLMVLFNC
jgi:hypothetical protein